MQGVQLLPWQQLLPGTRVQQLHHVTGVLGSACLCRIDYGRLPCGTSTELVLALPCAASAASKEVGWRFQSSLVPLRASPGAAGSEMQDPLLHLVVIPCVSAGTDTSGPLAGHHRMAS